MEGGKTGRAEKTGFKGEKKVAQKLTGQEILAPTKPRHSDKQLAAQVCSHPFVSSCLTFTGRNAVQALVQVDFRVDQARPVSLLIM